MYNATVSIFFCFSVYRLYCRVNWDLEIRVADFGLSRSVEGKDYYRMGHFSRLPVKWMAPECLIDLIFTSSSDVVSVSFILCLYFVI